MNKEKPGVIERGKNDRAKQNHITESRVQFYNFQVISPQKENLRVPTNRI
jgi:hypothetical protein